MQARSLDQRVLSAPRCFNTHRVTRQASGQSGCQRATDVATRLPGRRHSGDGEAPGKPPAVRLEAGKAPNELVGESRSSRQGRHEHREALFSI